LICKNKKIINLFREEGLEKIKMLNSKKIEPVLKINSNSNNKTIKELESKIEKKNSEISLLNKKIKNLESKLNKAQEMLIVYVLKTS
jgi:predicted  nucleic acid-binding Zn-ribbon protein